MPPSDGVGKGWIRVAVLDSLSKNPATLTSLARQLGIAKSTVDYHLRGLLERGLIEITETRVGRGGIVSKLYALGSGAVVLMPTNEEENEELRHLEEAYQVQTLAWGPRREPLDGQELRSLLYGLFLHLFEVTRSQHQRLLRAYGRRTGEGLAPDLASQGRKAALLELTTWMRRNAVASAELIGLPNSQSSVLLINDCLGSVEHPSRACWFLEGLVEGVVQKKLGNSYIVSRLDRPGIQACCLLVSKGGTAESRVVEEAILSSPVRTRGRRPTESES